MFRRYFGKISAMMLAAAVLGFASPSATAQTESADEVASRHQQIHALCDQGKCDEALPLAEKALPLAEAALGPDHPETFVAMKDLSDLYHDMRRFTDEEPLARRAFEGRARVLGKDHPDTLTSQHDLGLTYYMLNRYPEAEALDNQVLEARERVLGKEHADTLDSRNHLADVYHAQGRNAEAEPLYLAALEARERVLGKDHADTLESLNSVAGFYQNLRRYNDAEPLFLKAVETNERTLGKEHPETTASLLRLGTLYYSQGSYNKAEPLYQRVADFHERTLGKEHPETLLKVNGLAVLYQTAYRFDEAEPLYKRVLKVRERALGPDHPDTLLSLNNLASLYRATNRRAEAEALYKRVLDTRERVLGKEAPETLVSMENLGLLYQAESRYADAEPFLRQALEIGERVEGGDNPATLRKIGYLATLYRAQVRFTDAEALQQRLLEATQRVYGKDVSKTFAVMHGLGVLYYDEGRHQEAETLYLKALDGSEKGLGRDHPETLNIVNSLAALYYEEGRWSEAEQLHKRALEGRERALGKEHPSVFNSLNNLAALYQGQGRFSEAEPLYLKGIEASERVLGKDHPLTLGGMNNLSTLYQKQNLLDKALPLSLRTFEARERVLGRDHPDTANSAHNLGWIYSAQGRYGDAEELFQRALATRSRVLGEDHPDTLTSLDSLASLYFAQNDWARTVPYWRRSTALLVKRALHGSEAFGGGLAAKNVSEPSRFGWQFEGLTKALFRMIPQGQMPDAATIGETFQTAQWALGSDAAQSLAQMAVRGAKGDPKLAVLVRERQDLVTEWQRREKSRITSLGLASDKRDAQAEMENAERLAAIDARVAEIGKELAVSFPDYAALISPAPLSVEEVQAQLHADEALILFFDTKEMKPVPEETFLWIVTKTDARLVRSDLGTSALTREVRALRCGLDEVVWASQAGAERCGELLGEKAAAGSSGALPFDLARAHALYKSLFGEAEDLIKGKQLLLVPGGPLTQLPFQVLVTAPPSKAGGYRDAAWLIREHALTVLPAVSSLRALRRVAHASGASKAMIGFGNPLLNGPDSRYAKLAQRARDFKRCRDKGLTKVAAIAGSRAVSPMQIDGGFASLAQIRMQAPLPETADELCAVASDLNADAGEMYLGARATEREIKELSASGRLADYRVAHFATHGAMAGELRGTTEPGLLLTPPLEASTEDDGYLSASEIAELKLDADWVILSACNTAAGDAEGAQALSGLARAFFYAQARALLVSHWAVNSTTTVKLVTAAMREMAKDKTVGRAQALRRAELALINKGAPYEAHPAYWAPFIVVGEGAR